MKMDFDRTIVSNDNGWEYGGFGKKWGSPLKRLLKPQRKFGGYITKCTY
jgi:hypothetical protein